MVLDLNTPPSSVEEVIPVGHTVDVSLSLRLPGESALSQIQATTGHESVDEDVIICSPRSFVEAREKARRDRGVIEVIDADTEFQRGHSVWAARSLPSHNNRHRRGLHKSATFTGDCFILESYEKGKSYNDAEAPKLLQSAPPPMAPRFSCPVCMGPFKEETSTKCGHIFCKTCIHTALVAQSKCPTCRRKLKVKDTFRIYLPISD